MTATVAEATAAAERWASKAGVDIEPVVSERSAREAVRVLAKVWPQADDGLPLTPEMAWALAHSGNYVALARGEEGPVAAAVAFRGRDRDGIHLHSHMVGVLPPHQGASVGFAVKQHQRAWALGQGLPRVTWTFDPLVARNAYFNVVKLGARLTRYFVDFYGPLTDGINVGDESDRCLVTWDLAGESATAAAGGEVAEWAVSALRADGGVEVLRSDGSGEPVVRAGTGAGLRLAWLPADSVELRRREPARGRAWRLALREVLAGAFAEGLEVTGFSRDGCYVISAP